MKKPRPGRERTLPEPTPMTLSEGSNADAGEKDYAQVLLARPQDVPVTAPRDSNPTEPQAKLPVDRSRVVERPARLERSGRTGWYMIRFLDTGPDESPMRYVLFSQYLEQIEPLANKNVTLQVSGETTVYKKWAFLLLTSPPILVRQPIAPEPVSRPVEASAATTTAPASKASGAEDIRKMLLSGAAQQRPLPVPPSPKIEAVKPVPSVAPVPASRILDYGPPEIVADRVIRLVPEKTEGWLEARFESDNTLQQPPLRLLPCRQLEEAERIAADTKVHAARFLVSGRITQYKGKRYLLLSKLLRVRDMDQF